MKQDRNVCPLCGFYPILQFSGKAHCPSCDASFDLISERRQKNKGCALDFDKILKNVFVIEGCNGRMIKMGTCFAVGRETLLTCAHVITEGIADDGSFRYLNHTVKIGAAGESLTNARIVKTDKMLDLAVLKTEKRCFPDPLKLDLKKQTSGTHIYAVGNGKGNGISTVDGIISDDYRSVNGRSLLLISAPVITGYSGGPVMNDFGLVAGMVTGGEIGEATMNYAVPSDVISEFLQDCIGKE